MGASGNQPTQNAFQGASQAMQTAGQTYGGLAGFQAPQVSAARLGPATTMQSVGQVGDVTSGQLATTDMGQYMNPYTQQVIERGQQDIERQRQMASQSLGAQAQQAKAFGGSRHGVAEGVLGGEYARMGADLAAQQRQQAFQQAQQAAQYDIGQKFQADTLNQRAAEMAAAREQAARSGNMQAANQFAIQQAQFEQQANLANQQAALAGAGVQQAAAGGLAGLGGQAFGMGQQAQQAIGQQAAFQRGLQQQMIDAMRNQTMGAYGAPLAGLGALSQVLGTTPYGQTSTTSQPFNPASLLMLL